MADKTLKERFLLMESARRPSKTARPNLRAGFMVTLLRKAVLSLTLCTYYPEVLNSFILESVFCT